VKFRDQIFRTIEADRHEIHSDPFSVEQARRYSSDPGPVANP